MSCLMFTKSCHCNLSWVMYIQSYSHILFQSLFQYYPPIWPYISQVVSKLKVSQPKCTYFSFPS